MEFHPADPSAPNGQQRSTEQSHLMGLAAHELREPLTVLHSTAHYLRTSLDELSDEDLHEHLNVMEELTTEMLQQVTRFMEVAEIGFQALTIAPLRVQQLVDDVIASFEATATKKRIRILTDGPADLVVSADAGFLHQALANLLSNALKFSAPGVTVTLRWAPSPTHVRLSVCDEGQGIPAAEQDQLFEPFGTTSVQATHNEESTGLGLYLVRCIAEAHGGAVSVDSTPGTGACFTLTLPTTPR